MGTFQKYSACAQWVLGGQIASELTMNSPCTHWVNAPSPPVSEEIKGHHEDLVTRVDDMAGQLCHCARSVPISSVSDHSDLEYLSEGSYHIPPQEPCSHCSSNHVVPEENDVPLPIPAPSVPNDKNIDPSGSVCPTAPRLVRRQVLRRLGIPFRRPETCISTGVVVDRV